LKVYITLEEAKAKGYKYFCGPGSERCEELEDIRDVIDDYDEVELMDLETRHLILNAENIVENECESQEIWDAGEQISEKDIQEFQKACDKFNKAVESSTTSFDGSGEYIKLSEIKAVSERSESSAQH
jgi:hypothetical protein